MQFTIKTNELKALLLCAAKNDHRYYLNGAHFESTPNGIIAASTDGHRLLCINLPNEQAEGIKCLIPRALIEAAVKTKAQVIDIMIDGQNVTLSSAGQNVSGSLTEGVFPDFRRVVPQRVTGESGGAQFQTEYISDFDKIGKLINGGKASIMLNGSMNTALVKFTDENVIGVLMPLRHYLPTDLTRPDWIELPAAPMQAAA